MRYKTLAGISQLLNISLYVICGYYIMIRFEDWGLLCVFLAIQIICPLLSDATQYCIKKIKQDSADRLNINKEVEDEDRY